MGKKEFYTAEEYNEIKKVMNLQKHFLKKYAMKLNNRDSTIRFLNKSMRSVRDRISYLLEHNNTANFSRWKSSDVKGIKNNRKVYKYGKVYK